MSTLNGWWRIWIVVTVALLTFASILGLNQREFDDNLSSKDVCFPGTLEARIVSEPTMDNWTAYQSTPPEMLDRGEIIDPRVEVGRFSCVSWASMLKSWGAALTAALAILIVAYVVRWIGSGFNRSKY